MALEAGAAAMEVEEAVAVGFVCAIGGWGSSKFYTPREVSSKF